MSSIALTQSVATSGSVSAESRSVSRKRVTGVGAAATVASGLATILAYYVGDAFVRYDSEFLPLQSAVGDGIFAAVMAIPAVLIYALLLRKAANPARTFTIVSAVALVLSFVPTLTMLNSEPGVSNGQLGALCLMHVASALAVVPTLVKFASRRDS